MAEELARAALQVKPKDTELAIVPHDTPRRGVRARVEHLFLYVKRQFGYAKVRYRGLYKNTQRLAVLFGMANLMRAERLLAAS